MSNFVVTEAFVDMLSGDTACEKMANLQKAYEAVGGKESHVTNDPAWCHAVVKINRMEELEKLNSGEAIMLYSEASWEKCPVIRSCTLQKVDEGYEFEYERRRTGPDLSTWVTGNLNEVSRAIRKDIGEDFWNECIATMDDLGIFGKVCESFVGEVAKTNFEI